MITAADKYDLDHAFKDLIYELRGVRNSISAAKYCPNAIVKCRELELILQGTLVEISEMYVRTKENGELT